MVRRIETETFEENPALFQEYMLAAPDVKVLMDNQFKNVKTHARLLSKSMWYEWRMKLQDGLKGGLLGTVEGLDADDRVLQKQQDLLSSALPALQKHLDALEQQHEDLEAVARELADCDPEDLLAARGALVDADEEIAEKSARIEAMRIQLDELEASAADLTGRKQQCLEDIKSADKIREECRGWSSTEISALKSEFFFFFFFFHFLSSQKTSSNYMQNSVTNENKKQAKWKLLRSNTAGPSLDVRALLCP
jgi:kinetochore protein Spc7/SPC105